VTEVPPPSLGLPPGLLNKSEARDAAPERTSPDDPLLALEAKDLLANFAATGAQQPFEEIVRRYGGMVFNVCLEVTNNRHDAEDATQAAFLSLAIQARSGQQVIAIGPWLQQVARRMSLDINRSRKRRKNREDRHSKSWETRKIDTHDTVAGAANGAPPETAARWDELRGIINEELSQLPAKYRMPLILHYYGGMSRDEMAKELGCRTNTLGVRLHRAREMLGKRLAKRGVTLSGVVVGLYLVEIVRSSVSYHMVSATAQAAAMLTAGKTGAAIGLVSAPVVELAQTAGRVVATAKLKLAAMLALLAGGAAAASAEVMQHFQIDLPARIKSWDLGRFFRLPSRSSLPTPQFDTGPSYPAISKTEQTQSQPTQGKVNTGPNAEETVAQNPAPPRPQQIPTPTGWWPPIDLPRNVNPQPVIVRQPIRGNATPPPSPLQQQLDQGPTLTQKDDGLRAPAGGGGGGGGSGGGSKRPASSGSDDPPPDEKVTDKDQPRDKSRPQPKGLILPWDHANREDIHQDQNLPPGRGGVKQPPQDPSNFAEQDKTPRPGQKPSPNPRGPGQNPADPKIGPANQFDGAIGVKDLPTVGPHPAQPSPTPPPPPTVPPPVPPSQPANNQDLGIDPDAPIGPLGGIIDQDTGRLFITSRLTPTGQIPSLDAIVAAGGKSQARFELTTGELTSHDVNVGYDGAGVLLQSGGRHTLDSLFIGSSSQSNGLAHLTGGQMVLTRSAGDAWHTIEIGGAGEGELCLGDAEHRGYITETGEGTGVGIVVGAIRSARGTLQGWGKVHLTGDLNNNGKVIANGFGRDRTLDLASFTHVTNDHDNRTAADARGWYAKSGGKLTLPSIPIQASTSPQAVTWGEDAADDSIDLVNSARITFKAVNKPALLDISLLSLDRADVPALPTGHTFIGVWSFDLTPRGTPEDPTITGGLDLQVRYDHHLAEELGLSENVLKLWTFDDGRWIRHDFDASFTRDPDNHTLGVHLDGADFTHFAVSAPEPGTIGLTVLGLSLCLGSRRRRR
jgi:RNA polymerase sigma factor (sigma-70 family)